MRIFQWPFRPFLSRNGNQQQGECHLFDLAPEAASWSSRPCNEGRCAITYIHSERLNTRATHIQCCPGQPGGNFSAGFFTVKSPANRVRGATASGYVALFMASGVSCVNRLIFAE